MASEIVELPLSAMNPHLWAQDANKDASEKVRYWTDVWEYLIEMVGEPTRGLRFMNPHLLIRHIIDEIVFNNFQNSDNRAYFQRQLDFFLEHDPATITLFSTDLVLIRREFGSTRFSYLLQLCRKIDEAYSKSNYLGELFNCLKAIFKNDIWNNGDDSAIRIISQCMIVELSLVGYSLESIKNIPASLFSKKDLTFNNRSASKLDPQDFVKNGEVNFFAYHAALRAEVESLTIDDRVNLLSEYFHPEAVESYFIFQVEGLRGDSLDITVANVNLYSPNAKRYIHATTQPGFDNLQHEELFGSSVESCPANAAVLLNEFDVNSSEVEAIEKIDKALDLLRAFVTPETPFKVLANQYLRVSQNGQYWGGGTRPTPRSDPAYKLIRSLDLSEYKEPFLDNGFLRSADEYLFKNQASDSVGLRIAHSLHWYRKAEESQSSEDRLLSYWIALENLVSIEESNQNVLLPAKEKETKYSLIREIVPALDICVYVSSVAARLFNRLSGLLSRSTNGYRHLVLPDELLEKSLLRASNRADIDLSIFVSHLDSIEKAVSCKLVRDEVNSVKLFYTDTSWAKQEISSRLRATKDDILLLYRLRNLIVHNAHYDNSVLPLWVDKARRYAGNTIRQIVMDLFTKREARIESSLLRYHVELTRIQEMLDKGQPVDFLKREL